jgi:hypothetical protein
MTEAKTTPDWERIEGDYRAGLLSLREMSAQHGVPESTIRKKARVAGWERDLGAKIRARAEAKLARQAVVHELATANAASEREIIEANAERIAQVRGEHRADITRARTLALKLLGELEAQPELHEAFRAALRGGDQDEAKRLAAALLDLPARIKGTKELADTLRILIGLEREAYGLDTMPEGAGAVFGRIERVIVRAAAPDA